MSPGGAQGGRGAVSAGEGGAGLLVPGRPVVACFPVGGSHMRLSVTLAEKVQDVSNRNVLKYSSGKAGAGMVIASS